MQIKRTSVCKFASILLALSTTGYWSAPSYCEDDKQNSDQNKSTSENIKELLKVSESVMIVIVSNVEKNADDESYEVSCRICDTLKGPPKSSLYLRFANNPPPVNSKWFYSFETIIPVKGHVETTNKEQGRIPFNPENSKLIFGELGETGVFDPCKGR